MDRSVGLTGQYGPSLALLLHITVLLARQSEGRLEHKAVDVVMSLKVRLLFLLLLLIEVGHHVGDLDVGEPGVQVFRVHLRPNTHSIEEQVPKNVLDCLNIKENKSNPLNRLVIQLLI